MFHENTKAMQFMKLTIQSRVCLNRYAFKTYAVLNYHSENF